MARVHIPIAAAVLLTAGAVPLSAAPAAAAPVTPSFYRAAPGSVAPPAAVATSGRGREYGGTTRAGDPFVLGLARDRRSVAQVDEAWRAPCSSGGSYATMESSGAALPIGARGAFGGTRAVVENLGGPYAEVVVTVRGTLRGRSADGSLKIAVTVRDAGGRRLDRCALTTRFGVRSAAGRVFAGATSQHGPVVLEVAAGGGSVRWVRMAWQSSCRPQGWFQVDDTLERFPVDAAGRFGDDFKTGIRYPDGPSEENSYAVHGRIGPVWASGRVRVRTVALDASGATTASCDSGAIRFRVSSG